MTEILIHNIGFLCSKNNISINQMLKNCALNKSLIDNLKKGSLPSVDKISKIAEYFNVSTDYLLGNEQKENNPPESELSSLILKEIENCSEDEADIILQQIKLIKSLRNK